MFSGIIKDIGVITGIDQDGQSKTFTIVSELLNQIEIDHSVAHNGICLTVISKTAKDYKVTAILETLNITNAKDWKVGSKINLELALPMSAAMHGHLVLGHIEYQSRLLDIQKIEDNQFVLRFELDPVFNALVQYKGSVTVDGVSLTVSHVNYNEHYFEVNIIPFTWHHTIFSQVHSGYIANIEFDLIAKNLFHFYKVSQNLI
ncbi:MAG TPA: riboflavin synthase [Saprospiraceae bacterium]|nr:riboflavin synthase [Saprospiraceae bacterium]